MLAETFPPENVGNMNFHHRQFRQNQRIQYGHGRMCKRGRIYNYSVCSFPGVVNPADEFRLAIALAEIHLDPGAIRMGCAGSLDVGEGLFPVNLGFADSQHIQVGAIQN